MKEFIFQLIIFSTSLLFALTTAIHQASVQHFVLENELVLDLSVLPSNEWIIQTEPNHIFYFSFLINENVDEQQIPTSLTIVDVNNPDSLLYSSETNTLSPFYSTGNIVSIKLKEPSSTLSPFRLKLEKAVPCPSDIGSSTSCVRVVDELSCYCTLFTTRTWANTKSYCQSYNMSLLSIESYEEDLAVFNAFAGQEILWIGLSDTSKEGTWIWDSTGNKMSPGYMGWAPERPYSSCADSTADCAVYNVSSTIPAWVDLSCTSRYGGICELQPSISSIRSIRPVKLDLEEELVFEFSGSSTEEWIIQTDPNHIFYFTFVTPHTIDEHQKKQIISSITVVDINKPDSLLFPSKFNQFSPFYSTDNTVSITFSSEPSITTSLNGFQLKAQKAVPCPLNLGSSTSCGRVVDELSCYCAHYAAIPYNAMNTFCKTINMTFVSIETYEEDFAVYSAFGGSDIWWIGARDASSDGNWAWDTTGKRLSPGYQGWKPGSPYSNCGPVSYDCAAYTYYLLAVSELPAWVDVPCTSQYGGICELQPSKLSTF